MNMRRWPMIAILPVALLGALGGAGPAGAGPADGTPTCRQYIPSSGVTIAVECGQPVAVVMKASATVAGEACRRFVPSAQMSIEEPCPEPVAGGAKGAVAAKSGDVAPGTKVRGELVKATARDHGASLDGKTSAKAAALVLPGRSAPGGCAAIVERAQLGSETEHDLKTLRAGCAPGG